MARNIGEDFAMLWLSVVAGGLTSLYIARKYPDITDFSKLSSTLVSDLAATSFFIIFQFGIAILLICFSVNLFVTIARVMMELFLGPIKFSLKSLLPHKMICFLSKFFDEEIPDHEKGFFEKKYLPHRSIYNYLICVILLSSLFILRNIFIKAFGVESLMIFSIVVVFYGLFNLLICKYEKPFFPRP